MTEILSKTTSWQPPELAATVALVTGASRGVGQGVALALGDAGATVYVTGRSTRGSPTTDNLPGTIDETADEVSARGGKGIAIRCDHFDDAANGALFERIQRESGHLDLLVNNAWAGYERGGEDRFDAKFWDQPRFRWDLFSGSLRGQFVCSQLAAPAMIERGHGLIVNVSFNDRGIYLGNVAYDVCKSGSDRMVLGMANELRRFGVAAVSLHPGFVRTERVEAAWELLGDGPAQIVHTPEYVGRAVASLYADPDLLDASGEVLAVGDLAEHYGFNDIDGRRPPAFRLEGRMTLATRMERLNQVIARAGGTA
jgi:NAD(P)-dependent dehydrogenase (short-subunit alcohol dehydrogenase family)